ncbi:hypothetical protein [Actinophytocola sp. NPDC049390]|uniref:hypothetical protein n=1 Tax=Actinophytocola sp. NPDC049390 TaxID=3363894 RepID=UPI0037954AAC
MKVYTDCVINNVVVGNYRVLLLLRRVGVTAGLLFGLGLITMFMAGQASAEEQRHGGGERPGEESSEGQSRTGAGLLSGLVKAAEPVLEPVHGVVGAGAETLAPVVRSVTETVEPVTSVLEPVAQPVVTAVSPVLEVVRPVTEPVLDAATPVVNPVTEATGLDDSVSAIGGQEAGNQDDVVVPVQRAEPTPRPVAVMSTENVLGRPVESIARFEQDASGVSSPATEVTTQRSIHDGPRADSGVPGKPPGAPATPVNAAVGGNGSASGSARPHGADTLAPASAGAGGAENRSGRSPPGTITGCTWSGYDDRDHPS